MNINDDRLHALLRRLEMLEQNHEQLHQNLQQLRLEFEAVPAETETIDVEKIDSQEIEEFEPIVQTAKPSISTEPSNFSGEINPRELPIPNKTKSSLNIERIIGENIISIVGAIVIVVGVGFGVKYAIDNEMLSPLLRIVLGYAVGLGMFGFAANLKKKYKKFSAVLLSASMSVNYFVTFFAYSLYELIPQPIAFAVMTIFTVFTVIFALQYNRQIIALLGMTGAYAAPYLLSSGSGDFIVLFSYVALINLGIIVVFSKKNWRPLAVFSLLTTWLVYGSWSELEYLPDRHFTAAAIFLCLFFSEFFIGFLSGFSKLERKFSFYDAVIFFANSLLFYLLGYDILEQHEIGKEFLGIFTAGNALIYLCAAIVLRRRQPLPTLANPTINLLLALVLGFLTIAAPVQLNGEWVSLFWAAEAAVFSFIGRKKLSPIYSHIAVAALFLASLSIVDDWQTYYGAFSLNAANHIPFANMTFAASAAFAASALFVRNNLHFGESLPDNNKNYGNIPPLSAIWGKVLPILLSTVFLAAVYFGIHLEIFAYWEGKYIASGVNVLREGALQYQQYDNDLHHFQSIWLVHCTLLFFSGINIALRYYIKTRILSTAAFVASFLAMLVYLVVALYSANALQYHFLNQELSEYYTRDFMHILVRYISYIFSGLLLYSMNRLGKSPAFPQTMKKFSELFIWFSALWILASELVHFLYRLDVESPDKSWLSGFFVLYAIALLAIGIRQKKRYLRLSAVVLTSATLYKVFSYDIAHLDALEKTMLFVVVGTLMLIISFLYNKFRSRISPTQEE